MLEPALQQPRRLRIEEVGVAADLVHRPVGARRRRTPADRPPAPCRVEHLRAPDHVVEDEAAADRRAAGAARRRHVVDFLDLERRDVAVFGEAGRHAAESRPTSPARSPLTTISCVLTIRSGVPIAHVVPVGVDLARGGMSAGLPRGAPLSAHFAIFAISVVAQRRIVLELLDADVLLDVPGRHHAGLRADAGALLDGARPRPRPLRRSTSDIGATPSARWQFWQLRCRIGAMSFVKVTSRAGAGDCAFSAGGADRPAAPANSRAKPRVRFR